MPSWCIAMSASETSRRLRLAFVGWGAIATRVAELLTERQAAIDIVAIAVRDAAKARPDVPADARLISSPSELAGLVETAHLLRSPRNARRWMAALRRARGGKVKPGTTAVVCEEMLGETGVQASRRPPDGVSARSPVVGEERA